MQSFSDLFSYHHHNKWTVVLVCLYTYATNMEDLSPTWDTYYRAEAGENVAAKLSKYICIVYTHTYGMCANPALVLTIYICEELV